MAKSRKKVKTFDWRCTPTSRFLLKVAYIGSQHYGFAWQPAPANSEPLPTVERDIFSALLELQLIEGRGECNYSRCGRTDKGVHAAGNYVALDLRLRTNDEEYDYVKMLNAKLPRSVRILSAMPVPGYFDARFSCLFRVYKYFFVPAGMDLARMRVAAAFFIGEHDFRNFCKMDVEQVRHFRRRVISITVEEEGSTAVVTITGLSYLWHQIRCMMSVLFMVGRGDEEPSVIGQLLDVERMPQKPVYEMADESGLVLWNCFFEGIIEKENTEKWSRVYADMYRTGIRDAAVLRCLSLRSEDALAEPETDMPRHRQLLSRPVGPSLETRIESLTKRKTRQMLD
ncbi:MAG: hypothetical protein KVP17_003162 [Porospora cf. gigantea B]|uniref:uncharacterized protein n=1 Tax=Porospora cf. gigantea B TaxID=2853592 RepID=UPI003571A488|nr:MAG: hypothetical protein KVP17_003162 [Porospora cf. gigantea B]